MKYEEVVPAIFLRRPNRFIAQVELHGREETVHVKNTGRCRELLLPGVTVYLAAGNNSQRKTSYDLIAVKKITHTGSLLINMDSQAPNLVAVEWLKCFYGPSLRLHRAEYSWRDEAGRIISRFDHYVEYVDQEGCLRRKLWEVKGCTLENGGIAMFPDAPTARGVKHLRHLTQIAIEGEYQCGLLLIVQMDKCVEFRPNWAMDPVFSQALVTAAVNGVDIHAVSCIVTPDTLTAATEIPVNLGVGQIIPHL